MSKEDLERAKSQAIAQFESIAEMVSALEKAEESDDETQREDARRAIEEDALSVEVRSDWHSIGDTENAKASEYRILLCTGGPAVQIIGELSDYSEPETARIEFQDWFTPWTPWHPENREQVEKTLLTYARTFYFGE